MKNIRNFVITCSLLVSSSSFFQVIAMEKPEYDVKKIELLLTPWVKRKELASSYMNKAIQSNTVQEVSELIQDIRVITVFDPEDKTVDLQTGPFHDCIGYNVFMRWLDLANPQETKKVVADAGKSSRWCSFQ